MSAPPLLQVEDLRLSFGGVTAVDGLSFTVDEGDILSVIGPNGAGKTSAFNCITGFYKPTGGKVSLDGEDITRLRPSAVAAKGVSRTFQNLRLFGELTVLDNVRAGMHLRIKQNAIDALLHTPRFRKSERIATEEAHKWLDFVGLRGDRAAEARNLPYGEQRRVEIARALARGPRLLLLDEPAAGMSTAESARLLELLAGLPAEITVLFVEHDLDLVFSLADSVTVLHLGRVLLSGTPDEVRASEAVREAYLGAGRREELFLA